MILKHTQPCDILRRYYGAPLSRRRVFLVLVNVQVLCEHLREQGLQKFQDFVLDKMDSMRRPPDMEWYLEIQHVYSICCNMLLHSPVCCFFENRSAGCAQESIVAA